MYKITIKGEAYTSYDNLAELDGIECDDEFSEYFHNDGQKALIAKGVANGYMCFKYMCGKLWTVTTYESPVELSPLELEILKQFTTGQWSDGIGEGFEQTPCYYDNNRGEVYIVPRSDNQIVEIKQELICFNEKKTAIPLLEELDKKIAFYEDKLNNLL